MEFAQNVRTNWIFNSKPGKKHEICTFSVLRFTFQDVIYKKKKFTFLSYLHYQIINTNIVIQSHNDLEFHCFYLEITWKIHGISCHQISGNPGSCIQLFTLVKLVLAMLCQTNHCWPNSYTKKHCFGRFVSYCWYFVFKILWLHTKPEDTCYSYMVYIVASHIVISVTAYCI